jgi:hypothetical protein
MYSGPLRLVRALTVSATCVALSLLAHVLGAGPGEPVASVAAVLALVMITVLLTLVLVALSGQRWTLGRALVSLALGQAGLNAIFTVLLSPHHSGPAALAGGASMALAHGVAALVIGTGIAVNDSALDTYFAMASSQVISGINVLSPWRLAALIPVMDSATLTGAEGRGERFARWQRPRILTGLVVLQCLSRRGPPAFALAS